MRVGRNGDRKENEKMESLASLRKLITNSQFNILIPSTEGSALDRYWLAAWRYARGSTRNDLKDDLGIRGWWVCYTQGWLAEKHCSSISALIHCTKHRNRAPKRREIKPP